MEQYKDTRFSVDEDGNCYNEHGIKIGTADVQGYMRISDYLGRVNGKEKRDYYKVHRMVAETFIPNPDNLPQVNHKNGIKTDNRVENLEWCDGSYNIKHAYANGLIPRGEKHYLAKLSDIEVKYIRQQYATGKYTLQRIGDALNVTKVCIYNIVNWRTRKKVSL